MMKIKLILFSMIILTTVLVSGCQANKVVELEFRITWDVYSGRGDAINAIVQQFNEEHKYINVTLVSGNENREEVLEELNKASIDIYMVPYRFLKDDEINPLLHEVKEDFENEWAFYYDAVLEMTGDDNHKYGVPWIGHSMAIIYNKSLVKEAGVNPEEWLSYTDLLQACEAVTANTDKKALGLVGANHHDVTWMVNQFIYTFGGELIDCDENEVLINSQESVAAIDFYKNKLGIHAQEGWENHTGVDVMEAFGNGEIAFEIQGPWGVSDIWKRGYPFNVGVLPLSRIGMYSEVGPMMLTIPESVEYKEESVTFIKYMIEVEHLEQIMDGEYVPKYDAYYPFRVPIRQDMQDSDFFRKYPEFLAFIEGFKRPSINTPCDQWAKIQEDQYAELLNDIMTGKRSIEAGLEEVGK